MINPLAQNAAPRTANNFQMVKNIMGMLQGKDANMVVTLLAQKNPQFRQFVQSCQGKTPEQIAQQYGVDLNAVRKMMG